MQLVLTYFLTSLN